MRPRTVLPGILLLALSGGCAGTEPSVMEEAPTTWTVPAKYGFTLASDCGERALIGRFQVTVVDDKVVKSVGLDDAARRALMLRIADLVPTLKQLEEEAETARREGAAVVEVERDLSDAHPTKIVIDHSLSAVDDESCYTIEDYTIGLTQAPSPTPAR
ncbi:DUF6174 domain-containing protein [Amorphoplanes digitatis]|uniref:Lipoprotein n=1 Tax=Actinoplanes digitatis TaxID=1868 RepID=A0A7W7I5E3_9ACTN|nr:DUF6174 domain-containing protein [Actinoplanes digitatis]MBB4766782.1 hypothetical protein [Actinoplanes digitatis]GID96382.1 hypothetical protein Adi01nite_57940 [Actinoplanes digitatis]